MAKKKVTANLKDEAEPRIAGRTRARLKRYRCPLKSFSIEDFKAFGSEQPIQLKPITLVFGANSAGKSSILHSLILGHHALHTGDLNAHRTEIGGESVDLGGFHQYVYRRDTGNEVVLRYDFQPPEAFTFRSDLLKSFEQFQIQIRIGFDSKDKIPRISGYSVKIEGDELFRMLAPPGGDMRVSLWETSHAVSEKLFEACLSFTAKRSGDERDRKVFDEGIYEVLDTIRIESDALPPYRFRDGAPSETGRDDIIRKMLLDKSGDSGTALRSALSLFLPRSLEDLLRDLHDLFAESVGHLEYLGPLRKLPRRHLDDEEVTGEERASGAFAWLKVMQDEEVRNKVNAWLGDPKRLQTPYKLEVRSLVHEDVLRNVGAASIENLFLNFTLQLVKEQRWTDLEALSQLEPDDYAAYLEENPHFLEFLAENWQEAHSFYLRGEHGDEEADAYTFEVAKGDVVSMANDSPGLYDEEIRADYMENSDELQNFVSQQVDPSREIDRLADTIIAQDADRRTELSIIELRNNTALTHRDIGVGVSQILPVLVHAYASERKIIAIEQPEIHIHPKLQAELGDVFIESALGPNQNTFLLETHSEHLILRILRRIRETTEGDLEEGDIPIRPEDVCVLYVKPGNEGSEVVELEIDGEGEFVTDWPDGFFDERAKEIFG